MKKHYLVYELCRVFQNLNLNGLFMLLMNIPTLDQLHVMPTCFLTLSHLKSTIYLHHGSENHKY